MYPFTVFTFFHFFRHFHINTGICQKVSKEKVKLIHEELQTVFHKQYKIK